MKNNTPSTSSAQPPSSSNKIDLKSLQVLNSDLLAKDDEYTLVIKGKKQLLIDEKKKQIELNRMIEAFKREIQQCKSTLAKDKDDKILNLNYLQNELEYSNSVKEVKLHEYKRRIDEEEAKQCQLLNKIKSMNSKIIQYKASIEKMDKDNSLSTPEIKKATEDMQKFLSEI